MSVPDVLWKNGKFGATQRRDSWWVAPFFDFLVFASFLTYANWAAWQGNNYFSGPYLSPFYSPEIWGDSPHAWFGPKPGWFPSWLPFSPALLILWVPGLFRFTCYYYRGAYYKAFWADPPGCAVGEPRNSYLGEHSFPLILQNVHRYMLYLAISFLLILAYDVWKAMWFVKATGGTEFGIGLGTIILAVNVVFLGSYALGCHSIRHLIGGRVDCLSEQPTREKLYECVSCLNHNHKRWAWCSLFSVAFADIYVRLCAMGIWTDLRII
ncbi:MAG: succinate dehydrogenase [Candidatus Solibacter usitatus]|nr:succinate dehydrogenase [Candidatus Solibacter usitatus]